MLVGQIAGKPTLTSGDGPTPRLAMQTQWYNNLERKDGSDGYQHYMWKSLQVEQFKYLGTIFDRECG